MAHRKNIDMLWGKVPGPSSRGHIRRRKLAFEPLESRWLLAGHSGPALALDGVDDYAHIPDNATLDLGVGAAEDFTIETSFYVSDPTRATNQLLIYKNNAYSVFFNANGVFARLYVAIGSYIQLQHLQPLSSGWHHVAAVFDNEYTENQDLFALYVNGSLAASNSGFEVTPGINNSTSPLNLGANTGAVPFSGWMDEVRFSDTVRYSGSSHTVPTSPFTSDLNTRALWHFDEPVGSTVFLDSSGNGNTLTGVNGAQTGNPPSDDTTPPTVVSLSPPDNATGVALNTNLIITFNENVQKGTGNIVLKKSSDNSVVETIAVTNAAVSISGATATIVRSTTLAETTGYYLEVAGGAFRDLAGNNFAGISGPTAWNFTTGDFTAPTVVSLSPPDDATDVQLDANLIITFNENVQKGTGNIVLKKSSDNSVVETIAVTNAAVSISGATATIVRSTTLAETTGYYVEVASGAFKDLAGNNFAGISGPTAWNFTTGDFTAPTFLSLSPPDDATDVELDANLIITFNENVQKGTGNIVLKKSSDNSVVETIAVTNAAVSISGATATIVRSTTLAETTGYYVEVASGAFKDLGGNNFAGISGPTAWNFTTGEFTAPTVVSLSPPDDATDVELDANLIITFNENVQKGTGNIVLKKSSDNSVVETIAVTNAAVSLSGATATIARSTTLAESTGYYVEVASGAFEDLAGNAFGGISGSTAWTFTTTGGIPLTVIDVAPSLAGGTLAAGITSLRITFSEPVKGADLAENYQLQSLGPDGLLGTVDDVIVPLSVSYSGTTATLTFAPLPESVYRLTVRDTITDLVGKALDGDRDGNPGGLDQRHFVAIPPAGGMFMLGATHPTGNSPISVTVGDFNGDGNPDLAVANYYSHNVAVLLGNGAGGFAAPTTFASGGYSPRSVTVGDFNGDGKPDLAIVNSSSYNVAVLLGNGAGGFAAPTTFAGGDSPCSVTIGDFNGDGKPDLAVANYYNNNVAVLLGNGAGGFAAPTTFASGGTNPSSVTVGDFNGDGKPDLAVANASSNNVAVLLGNGAGGFAAPTTFASGGTNPSSVTVGDFNGDGKPDLAVANASSHNVAVLLGNGAGGFAAPTTFAGGYAPYSVTVGDFNGDGKPDLAVANHYNVAVLLGNGVGGFAAPATFASAGDSPISVTVGDFNGDGKPDLAVANYSSHNVAVLLGNGAGGFAAPTTFASGGFIPYSVTVGDFNGDGKPDLAVANVSSNNVAVLLGNGAGGFAAPTTFSSGGDYPYSVTVGDFNGDGKPDLAVANNASDNVAVLLGNGAGGFAAPTTFASGGFIPYSVTVGDFNGDGNPDLAVANYDNVAVLLGNGAGGFAAPTTFAFGGYSPRSVTVGDFNGDGNTDLAVANAKSHNVAVLLGNGAGGFAAPTTFASGGNGPYSVTVGDFDGDGNADLAVANSDSYNVAVLLGNGAGGFAAPTTFASGGNAPRSVTVGDFNGDGNTDLAVAHWSSDNVAVLLGNGAGGFAAPTTFASRGGNPISVTVGDCPRRREHGKTTDHHRHRRDRARTTCCRSTTTARGNIVITDANEQFTGTGGIPGATLSNDNKTLTVPLASITGTKIVIDGAGGVDTLTADLTNPLGKLLEFHGGDGDDALVLTGGSTHTSTFTYLSASDGSVALDPDGPGPLEPWTVTYTGLAPITSTIASDVVELVYTGGDETITISDAGDGQTTAVSTLGGLTTFINPTELLRIVATSGTDTIDVGALAAGYASIEIEGDDATDVVNFNGPITFAPDHGLTVAGRRHRQPAHATSDIIASGTGAVSITALRNIALASGSSITTVDGAHHLSANQQATPTAGTFTGISLNGASVSATGAGSITLAGRGGTVGENVGIQIQNDGQVTGTTGTSSITLLADSMTLTSTPSVDAGSNAVVLRPQTAGTRIDLGGADVLSGTPLTLGLTGAELDRITAGTLTIGDAASGPVTISAAITRPSATNVYLISGGGIVFDPGSIDTGGGTLHSTPAPRSSR
jgi:methionine-rich copper-binding protein CopC